LKAEATTGWEIVAQGFVLATLKPGDRIIKMLNLNLAGGYSYNFGAPIITRFEQNKF